MQKYSIIDKVFEGKLWHNTKKTCGELRAYTSPVLIQGNATDFLVQCVYYKISQNIPNGKIPQITILKGLKINQVKKIKIDKAEVHFIPRLNWTQEVRVRIVSPVLQEKSNIKECLTQKIPQDNVKLNVTIIVNFSLLVLIKKPSQTKVLPVFLHQLYIWTRKISTFEEFLSAEVIVTEKINIPCKSLPCFPKTWPTRFNFCIRRNLSISTRRFSW